ncbi:MAG: toxin-antitoxin system, antitoxin component [Austwickia sp.]|nr:MAG: toxin-antitoxin system, antitoxin component [Austwickia sp.]
MSRTFKSRAAAEGRSLSDYLLGELTRLAERPTMREVMERVEQRGRVDLPPAADVLAEQRAGR